MSIETSGREGGLLLIVGGNDEAGGALRDGLGELGRDIVWAATAAEAIQVLAETPVSFMVLHLFLPDRDGRELLAKVCESPKSGNIPILVVSPKGNQRVSRDEGVFPNVVGYCEEPVLLEEILRAARPRLRRSRETLQGAWRDPMTGLPNRGGFLRQADEAARACARAGEPMALAMLSIDGFGPGLRDADTEMGREMCRRAASLLSNCFRATDIIGRWAVTEFAVAFPGESDACAQNALDKAVKLARETELTVQDRSATLAFSAGVVLVKAGEPIEKAEERAQEYLFQVHTSGGDGVVSQHTPREGKPGGILMFLHDDLTTRVMQRLLEKHGFRVYRVSTSDAGREQIDTNPPFRLIVVDETFFAEQGMTLLGDLRERPKSRRVPILAVMGRNAQEHVMQALELGANDYVVRPFSPAGFMVRVRRLLSRGVALDSASLRMYRVLLVDDDLKQLVAMASALYQRKGLEAYLARSISDAITRLADLHPDVMVLNPQMPGVDVSVLTDGLVAANGEQYYPMLILSAEPEEQAALRQQFAGMASGFLPRPLQLSTFGQELERLIGVLPGWKRQADSSSRFNAEIQRAIASSMPEA